jgi:hypothetical protein
MHVSSSSDPDEFALIIEHLFPWLAFGSNHEHGALAAPAPHHLPHQHVLPVSLRNAKCVHLARDVRLLPLGSRTLRVR